VNSGLSKILVVDDDRSIRRLLSAALEAHGYLPMEARDGAEALKLAAIEQPQLVVLDLGLPDIDGLDVLGRLREWSSEPVIVLSVRAREAEKVRALELGADDYVTKPFGMPEFLARVKAALRRIGAGAPPPVFKVGGLKVDLPRRQVTVDDVEVRLSPKQYRLLQLLVVNAGKVVTHHQLLRELWGPAHVESVQYLRIFVRKLRNRIEADPSRPRYLHTELGVGYRLRAPDQLDA
jgi:two-component system KDP operon response regulator KdpE